MAKEAPIEKKALRTMCASLLRRTAATKSANNKTSDAKIKKSSSKKLSIRKGPSKSTSSIFGSNTPGRNLLIAQIGNITAAEQLVFLPDGLRSHDILYRFVQNQGETKTFTNIINYHRRSVKGHGTMDNSVRKRIQTTMRERGYEGWTTAKHRAGDFQKSATPGTSRTSRSPAVKFSARTFRLRVDLAAPPFRTSCLHPWRRLWMSFHQ